MKGFHHDERDIRQMLTLSICIFRVIKIRMEIEVTIRSSNHVCKKLTE